jgi:hypothetical protein
LTRNLISIQGKQTRRLPASEEAKDTEIIKEDADVSFLLVAASVVPSSPILGILIIEAPSSCETSVLTRATRRNIPEEVATGLPTRKKAFERKLVSSKQYYSS